MIDQIEADRGSIPDDLPRGVSPEIAASNKDVQAIIQPRLTMLMEIADSFLLTIIEALETVPYGIRWICKQIRSLTRVSFGCLSEEGWLGRRDGRLGGRRRKESGSGLDLLADTFAFVLSFPRVSAEIPRSDRLRPLLPHRRLLLFTFHQPRHRYSSSLHARRWSTCEASETDSYSCMCLFTLPPLALRYLVIFSMEQQVGLLSDAPSTPF